MRTMGALTDDERGALAIWQGKLRDSTLSQDEHEIASTKIQEILHTGPFGHMYEALSAFDAKLTEIHEGKSATGIGKVGKELKDFKDVVEEEFDDFQIQLETLFSVTDAVKDEVNKAVAAAAQATAQAPNERITACGERLAELATIIEQIQVSVALQSDSAVLSQLIKDEVDSQVRAVATATVHEILGESEDKEQPDISNA